MKLTKRQLQEMIDALPDKRPYDRHDFRRIIIPTNYDSIITDATVPSIEIDEFDFIYKPQYEDWEIELYTPRQYNAGERRYNELQDYARQLKYDLDKMTESYSIECKLRNCLRNKWYNRFASWVNYQIIRLKFISK